MQEKAQISLSPNTLNRLLQTISFTNTSSWQWQDTQWIRKQINNAYPKLISIMDPITCTLVCLCISLFIASFLLHFMILSEGAHKLITCIKINQKSASMLGVFKPASLTSRTMPDQKRTKQAPSLLDGLNWIVTFWKTAAAIYSHISCSSFQNSKPMTLSNLKVPINLESLH